MWGQARKLSTDTWVIAKAIHKKTEQVHLCDIKMDLKNREKETAVRKFSFSTTNKVSPISLL